MGHGALWSLEDSEFNSYAILWMKKIPLIYPGWLTLYFGTNLWFESLQPEENINPYRNFIYFKEITSYSTKKVKWYRPSLHNLPS